MSVSQHHPLGSWGLAEKETNLIKLSQRGTSFRRPLIYWPPCWNFKYSALQKEYHDFIGGSVESYAARRCPTYTSALARREGLSSDPRVERAYEIAAEMILVRRAMEP